MLPQSSLVKTRYFSIFFYQKWEQKKKKHLQVVLIDLILIFFMPFSYTQVCFRPNYPIPPPHWVFKCSVCSCCCSFISYSLFYCWCFRVLFAIQKRILSRLYDFWITMTLRKARNKSIETTASVYHKSPYLLSRARAQQSRLNDKIRDGTPLWQCLKCIQQAWANNSN